MAFLIFKKLFRRESDKVLLSDRIFDTSCGDDFPTLETKFNKLL